MLTLRQRNLFVYHFTHALATPPWSNLGAFHALELAFVFNNFGSLIGHTPTPEELELAETMLAYWTNFAKQGVPDGAGVPSWPAYRLLTDTHLNLDTPVSTGARLRKSYCDFWCRTFRLLCL